MPTFLFCGEFLLHIPTGFFFIWGVSLKRPVPAFIFIWGVSLTHPYWLHFYVGSFSYTSLLASFLYGEFLLNVPCCFCFVVVVVVVVVVVFTAGRFSYTSRDGTIFM